MPVSRATAIIVGGTIKELRLRMNIVNALIGKTTIFSSK